MFYIYILESTQTGRWYIGSSENVLKRLQKHNAGSVRSTKAFRPYKIIHTEAYATKKQARQRELTIKKSGIIRAELKRKLQSVALSSNG